MVMRTGERWHGVNPECKCTLLVFTDGHLEGENPRCACGSILKETYSPPNLTYLEFLSPEENAGTRRFVREG